MSMVKAIHSGAEHRKTYKQRGKPGEYDRSCRPHGAGYRWPCPYCERNRLVRCKRLTALLATQDTAL